MWRYGYNSFHRNFTIDGGTMKALIVTILVSLSFQAQAISPNQMDPEQKAQLIHALNQLEPEVLDNLLTDEALEWYSQQFSRNAEVEDQDIPVFHGRADLGFDAFADKNAPTFN